MISTKSKLTLRLPLWLAVTGVLAALAMLWLAVAQVTVRGAANAEPELTPQAYLPLVARLAFPGDVIVNGGFEDGEVGWHQYSSGGGTWLPHDLIGTEAEGYNPYEGEFGATLGGYECSWDVLTQTVTIPAGGRLSYWWQMHTYETTIFVDNLKVDLLTVGGELVTPLSDHGIDGPEGIWQQKVVDVSAYAGQTLVLRFHAYNDNYYFSWFDLDLICLRPAW
jgi:hypothetical protein